MGKPRKRRSPVNACQVPDDDGKERYIRDGGWIQNGRGWWHPPNCLASWPLYEAYLMAKDDERKGMRMSQGEVKDYLRYG